MPKADDRPSIKNITHHALFNPIHITRIADTKYKHITWYMSRLHVSAALGALVEDDLRSMDPSALNSTKDILGRTPLALAVEEQRVSTVEMLLGSPGLSVTEFDKLGNTVLHTVLKQLEKQAVKNIYKQLEESPMFQILRVFARHPKTHDGALDCQDKQGRTVAALWRGSASRIIRREFEYTLLPSVLSALHARPPREFQREDFEALYKIEENVSKLENAVFSMLEQWGLARGNNADENRSDEDHKKRDYIESNIICLRVMATKFNQLKKLANSKSDALFKLMHEIRDQMKDDPDGLYIVRDLQDVKGKVNLQISDRAHEMMECAPKTPLFYSAIDTDVLVPLVATIAQQLHAQFIEAVLSSLMVGEVQSRGEKTVFRNSLEEELGPGWSRWVMVAPVKKGERMKVKVQEYAEENEAEPNSWPHIANLGDTLRAMVVCKNAREIRRTWEALQRRFDIREGNGRLKNRFATAGKKGAPTPDMLMNAVFQVEGAIPMPVEIQIHHAEILPLKEEEHFLYEIRRAKAVKELREHFEKERAKKKIEEDIGGDGTMKVAVLAVKAIEIMSRMPEEKEGQTLKNVIKTHSLTDQAKEQALTPNRSMMLAPSPQAAAQAQEGTTMLAPSPQAAAQAQDGTKQTRPLPAPKRRKSKFRNTQTFKDKVRSTLGFKL